MFNACQHTLVPQPGKELAYCLAANFSQAQLLELHQTLSDTASNNVIIANFKFVDPFYTTISRDVSYTWQSLICKLGFHDFLPIDIKRACFFVQAILAVCWDCVSVVA